jgi:hypothetical protein
MSSLDKIIQIKFGDIDSVIKLLNKTFPNERSFDKIKRAFYSYNMYGRYINGQLVGVILLTDNVNITITHLAVSTPGCGIGTSLIKYVLDLDYVVGKNIFVELYHDELVSFYSSLGFKVKYNGLHIAMQYIVKGNL